MIKGNLLKVGFDESFINENTFDTCILAIFGKGFGYYLPTALQETKGVRYPISSEYFENFLVRLYESNNGENLLKFIGVIDTFINQRSPELSIFWNYCLI